MPFETLMTPDDRCKTVCDLPSHTPADPARPEASPPQSDTVLRVALVVWKMDPQTSCTPEQQTWLQRRLQDMTPLSARERARLRGPLLAWYATRHPTCRAHVEAAFAAAPWSKEASVCV